MLELLFKLKTFAFDGLILVTDSMLKVMVEILCVGFYLFHKAFIGKDLYLELGFEYLVGMSGAPLHLSANLCFNLYFSY